MATQEASATAPPDEKTEDTAPDVEALHVDPDDTDGFYQNEDGVYPGVPEADYHQSRRASNSVLSKLIDRSPAHAKAALDDEYDPSSAQRFGTALHKAVLEPSIFDLEYATKEQCAGYKNDGDRCSYNGKHPWVVEDPSTGAEVIRWFCSTHEPEEGAEGPGGTAVKPADVETLSESKMEKVQTIRRRIDEHPAAATLLYQLPGLEELTILWTHEATGVPCKSRIDRLVRHPELGYVAIDLKTTRNAKPGIAPGTFGYDAAKFTYDRQAAFYLEGLGQSGIPTDYFLILAVEKDAPYSVTPFLVGHENLEQGRKEFLEGLREFRQCRQDGEWPHYSESIVRLDLPGWRFD